jgi:hypothetical protein
MENIFYPEPSKKDEWLKEIADLWNKGFMTDQELYQCYQLGGMPKNTQEKIKIRKDLHTQKAN